MGTSRRGDCLNIRVTFQEGDKRRHLNLIRGGDSADEASLIFRFVFTKKNPSRAIAARYHGYVLRYENLESVPAFLICYRDGNICLRMKWHVISRMRREMRTGQQTARQPFRRSLHKKRKK